MARIARIEAWPVNVPLEAPYEMAPGIVAGIHRGIVRVTTEDGIVGLGEATAPEDAADLSGERGQRLVGRDADDVRRELGRRERPAVDHRADAKVLVRNPLAGVEIALWDIASREANVPLHRLLGERVRSKIAFTEYFAYRAGREETPHEVAGYCARMAEEHGSRAFEGKVAIHSPADDVALAREVRAAVGADCELRLDANMGWSRATAEDILRLIEPYEIANVEEPVASWEELAALRRTTRIPFSAHAPDPERAAALGAPDTLVVGLGFAGGISGTRRLIADCERLGVGFWFYSGDLGIAAAAYLHIAAATPSLDRPSQSLLRWTADDVIEGGPFAPADGVLPVPETPGLGVSLDEAALARCVERFGREGPYDFYGGPALPRY